MIAERVQLVCGAVRTSLLELHRLFVAVANIRKDAIRSGAKGFDVHLLLSPVMRPSFEFVSIAGVASAAM